MYVVEGSESTMLLPPLLLLLSLQSRNRASLTKLEALKASEVIGQAKAYLNNLSGEKAQEVEDEEDEEQDEDMVRL